MNYPILEPITERKIVRHSSINQYSSMLSSQKAGVWLPIVSDVIDYIDCEGVHSHEAMLTDNDEYVGYDYPVEKKVYYTDLYVKSDHQELTKEPLEEWFGIGFYKKYANEEALTTSDTNSLGTRSRTELTIGLDYYLPKDKLPAVK